jgi:DNA polymerase III delta subunit
MSPLHAIWPASSTGQRGDPGPLRSGRPPITVDLVSLVLVSAPSNAGPGERQQMLDAADAHFAKTGVDHTQVMRIDVPGRGAGEEGDGALRTELEPVIPMLQSGSLFGGAQGLELVDAQNLQAAEGILLVELIRGADLAAVEIVLVAAGAIPRSMSALVKEVGSSVSVQKMRDRQAAQWLSAEIRDRGMVLEPGADRALLQRFGTDTASMGQALDQLTEATGKITTELIMDRFQNRPDEPAWLITEAISKGDVAEALRRLSDFLVHGHPLVYLASVETDLKKRALAAAAPNEPTLREWMGARPGDKAPGAIWRQRGKVRESSLRRAQEALVRADRVIKSQPEEVHRVTLERLTVALCRWYG